MKTNRNYKDQQLKEYMEEGNQVRPLQLVSRQGEGSVPREERIMTWRLERFQLPASANNTTVHQLWSPTVVHRIPEDIYSSMLRS